MRAGDEERGVFYYVGILDGSKDVWGVRIPDIPGCYGGGSTPEAAVADAISALREFAAHQATRGIALQPPRSVQDVLSDGSAEFDAAAGEAMVLVPLLLDQARPVKANVSLDAGLLEAIDDEAKRRGLTRSSFLSSAAIDKIQLSTDNQVVAIRKLRSELLATHERLARQATQLFEDVRRVGAPTPGASSEEQRSGLAERRGKPGGKRLARGARKGRAQ
jgi:predicted RNase H-like HicB family nuclease